MKKKKSNDKERGLRTFFLYACIVCFVILVSLSIKAIFIIKQNKFDGQNLNLAIAQNNQTTEIVGFNTVTNSITILKIKKSNIPLDKASEKLGIIPDAKLSSEKDLSEESATSILTKSMFRSDFIRTDLTIFDIARLLLFAKTDSGKNRQKEITLSSKDYDNNKVISSLFKNDSIASENISIEIINATEKSGLGNRLERSLSNIGAQVISVSTSHEKKKTSVIQYFGKYSYTLSKLEGVLNFPVEEIKDKSIADIVIIIGEDMENTSVF